MAADAGTAEIDPQVKLESGMVAEEGRKQKDEDKDEDIDLIYDISDLSYSQPEDQSRKMLEGLVFCSNYKFRDLGIIETNKVNRNCCYTKIVKIL